MNGWLDTDARLLGRLRDRMDQLFSQVLDERTLREGNGFWTQRSFPPVNCWEDEKNLYAECELPGVRMEDLDVSVVGRELVLKGERKAPELEGATYHRRERDTGTFHRTVRLPVAIDSGKVKAELRHGVLTISLPKAPEARPRKIEVKSTTKRIA